MTPETLNEMAAIRQACLDEMASMRAEFHKELARANEKIRALHLALFQNRAAVKLELELLRHDIEWLEEAQDARAIGGPVVEVSQKLDRMMGRLGYAG